MKQIFHHRLRIIHQVGFPQLQSQRAHDCPSSRLLLICEPKSMNLLQNHTRSFSVSIRRRVFNLEPGDLNQPNISKTKSTLKRANFDYAETHSCLSWKVPKQWLSSSTADSISEDDVSAIYVNKVTGSFVAPDFGLSGPWRLSEEFIQSLHEKKWQPHLSLPKLPCFLPTSEDSIQGWTLWKKATPISDLSDAQFNSILKSFRLSVREYKMFFFTKYHTRVLLQPDKGEDPSIQLLFPIKYIDGTLIGFRRVYLCSETQTIKEESLPVEISGMPNKILPFPHGLHQAFQAQARSIVIVPSVLDSVLLSGKAKPNHLFPVALAEGTSTFPPDHLPFYEKFKITFWFPETPEALHATFAYSKKLGVERCRVMHSDIAQPSKSLKPGISDMSEYIDANSQECQHEHVITFETLRPSVYQQLVNAQELKGYQWKRMKQLNDIMQGFRPGELTIFSGRTGTGKTTFLSEYSVDLCMQGVKTLWGSFEVTNPRLALMQLKQFSEANMDKDICAFDKFADEFSKLPMYYLTFHGSQEVNKVLNAVRHAVYLYDISHVIIDNLQFMIGVGSNQSNRFFFQDQVIAKFRDFATVHNVHVTLVIHPRKEDPGVLLSVNSIYGGGKASQEADNILLLQSELIETDIKNKYVEIAKNRFSGDLGSMPLFFNKSTLTFSKDVFLRYKAQSKKNSSN